VTSKWIDGLTETTATSEVPMDARGEKKLAGKMLRISLSTLLAMLAEAAVGTAASG
jgi:hypothetical protein